MRTTLTQPSQRLIVSVRTTLTRHHDGGQSRTRRSSQGQALSWSALSAPAVARRANNSHAKGYQTPQEPQSPRAQKRANNSHAAGAGAVEKPCMKASYPCEQLSRGANRRNSMPAGHSGQQRESYACEQLSPKRQKACEQLSRFLPQKPLKALLCNGFSEKISADPVVSCFPLDSCSRGRGSVHKLRLRRACAASYGGLSPPLPARTRPDVAKKPATSPAHPPQNAFAVAHSL